VLPPPLQSDLLKIDIFKSWGVLLLDSFRKVWDTTEAVCSYMYVFIVPPSAGGYIELSHGNSTLKVVGQFAFRFVSGS
jgi:hypothetical protein